MAAARRGLWRAAQTRAPPREWRGAARARVPDKGWPARRRTRQGSVGRAPAQPSRRARRTMTWRRPGQGIDSQREIAARDDVLGFAHTEDVDQLAGVLKTAEVGPVVDHVLCEGFAEARDGDELFDCCGVEVGASDDGAGC